MVNFEWQNFKQWPSIQFSWIRNEKTIHTAVSK